MKSFTYFYPSLTLDKKVSSTTPIVNELNWWLDYMTFEAWSLHFKGKEKGDTTSIVNNVHNQLLQKCQKGEGKEKYLNP
jgi:hypothetical protein